MNKIQKLRELYVFQFKKERMKNLSNAYKEKTLSAERLFNLTKNLPHHVLQNAVEVFDNKFFQRQEYPWLKNISATIVQPEEKDRRKADF